MSDSRTIIEHYLEITKKLESPTSFLEWGAISLISAALRDNVYFTFADRKEKICANTYIIIKGDSATVRKSPPFNINESLLTELGNTKIISGSGSMQGILLELGSAQSESKAKDGSCIMLAREIEGFFVKDPGTIGLITDMYDFKENYTKKLAGSFVPPVKNLCVSFFGGSNDIMLKGLVDQMATQGGFLGRTILIEEKKRRLINSGFEDDAEKPLDSVWDPIRKMLRDLSLTRGEIFLEEAARILMNEWYHSIDLEKCHTKTGFEGRLQTHAMKLAIIFAASRPGFRQHDNKPAKITREDLDRATAIVSSLVIKYKQITLGTGEANNSHAMHRISLMILTCKKPPLIYGDILRQTIGDIEKKTVDEVLEQLEAAELIKLANRKGVTGWECTAKLLEIATKNAETKKSEGKATGND